MKTSARRSAQTAFVLSAFLLTSPRLHAESAMEQLKAMVQEPAGAGAPGAAAAPAGPPAFQKAPKKNVYENAVESVVRINRADGSSGSGSVIDASGLILTNAHVVKSEKTVTIQLYALQADGSVKKVEEVEGTVVGKDDDDDRDIAIVRIKSERALKPVIFGNSSALRVTDPVFTIGSPHGIKPSLTRGVVSAVNAVYKGLPRVQTDAAVNPGNSGGPLFNEAGEQIAVNSYGLGKGDSDGVSYSTPIDILKKPIAQIIKNGKSTHGMIGVGYSMLDKPVRCALAGCGFAGNFGVLVGKVVEDGPGAKAGLKVGDVLYKLNGSEITELEDIAVAVNLAEPGATLTFDVFRAGKVFPVKVVVKDRDGQSAETAASGAPAKCACGCGFDLPKGCECNRECGEAGCNCELKKIKSRSSCCSKKP